MLHKIFNLQFPEKWLFVYFKISVPDRYFGVSDYIHLSDKIISIPTVYNIFVKKNEGINKLWLVTVLKWIRLVVIEQICGKYSMGNGIIFKNYNK